MLFDEVLDLEDDAFKSGHKEGSDRGRQEGTELGLDAGNKKCVEVLSEVGVYRGFCAQLMEAHENKNIEFQMTQRQLQVVMKAHSSTEEVGELLMKSSGDVAIIHGAPFAQKFEEMQGRFRTALAVLGISSRQTFDSTTF
eukprot:TRINITY_DN5540_c0_g1_i1.p2 TRINITY_DN5540_c0_g1~~TRINITY_DN5540_c0_g1_i1.p2  ORF type:complete len:140 (+),score=49.61 TRINITY_DN5540_c0_g1_i1:362-781(+)